MSRRKHPDALHKLNSRLEEKKSLVVFENGDSLQYAAVPASSVVVWGFHHIENSAWVKHREEVEVTSVFMVHNYGIG